MLRILQRLPSALCGGVLLAAAAAALAEGPTNVAATKHNLTSSGPGPIRVAGSKGVCLFCHTPHSANPIAPLWNRNDPGTYYQTYESTTLAATVGQPTGSSRLCLSCHDGTIALTQTVNSRNMPGGTIYITPRDRGYLGTDLGDDHPISFVYDAALTVRKGEMASPSSLPRALKLDHNNQLQCTTCHDPHDDRVGKFLVMSNEQSAMCRACHRISGWEASAHARSSASLAAAARDRWDHLRAGTVAQAACEACHRPHSAGGRQRLLRHEAEEDNCLCCHDGSVSARNIGADLGRLSVHPVAQTTGVHDPVENYQTMPKHVECADCHDPHRSRTGSASHAPFIRPSMYGASGLSAGRTAVPQAIYEYQVCYKCHAGTGTVRTPLVDRVWINTDVSDEFATVNPSFHPVEAQGRNRDVPSLLEPWRTTSWVYCTDCHGSSSSGARGPHGSAYRPLLVRNYDTLDLTSESPAAYALCYGCHNRSSILADRSFSRHKKHVVDQRAPCSVCHDPHGISATQARGTSGTHLINFERLVVLPSKATGRGPTFEDRGNLRGSCTLSCHGRDHVDQRYPE